MEISVKIRSAYGREIIDPICDRAKIFAAIAGTKTLTTETLKQIQSLGVAIDYHYDKPSFVKSA